MTTYGQCRLHSATLRGVSALAVDVEVSVARGLPGFCIVGMPDVAVQEARERVKSAIRTSGFQFPYDRIIVNLAPGSVRKAGSGFDLPIALGVLAATGQIDYEAVRWTLFAGELALDGAVREVPGLLAYAICAKEQGLDFTTAKEQGQLVAIDGLEQFGLGILSDILTMREHPAEFNRLADDRGRLDFADVYGHDRAKRALQIAATGSHGVVLMGPPGSGKTMLASRMPSILPELGHEEIMETAVIHSVCGLDNSSILAGIRPFRAPHHSATSAGLLGGGTPIKPGEVSLAHNGVLFLDELAEFAPSVMQGLRQIVETGSVTITRADNTLVFPAKFQLIGASNPCPCGYYGDDRQACRCTYQQVMNYQNRIGGPLVDRMDMRVDVGRLEPGDVLRSGQGVSSDVLRAGVQAGREFRMWRTAREEASSGGSSARLVAACRLNDDDAEYFERAAKAANMSGRGIMRVLGVARTIADIDQSERVTRDHLFEAYSLRVREGS